MTEKNKEKDRLGWISLHRKLHNSQFWLSEPFTRPQAWVDLLMLANHKDGFIRVAGERITIKRGQCGWSSLRLSERWRWSRGKVLRFLSELEKIEQQIVQQKTARTTIITIINYNLYQTNSTTNSTTDGHQIVQQTDTNNNENNVNNENNNVLKNLEKFFRSFLAPNVAKSKASYYASKNSKEAIKKALNNSACIGEGGFIECLKHYNKR